MKSDQIREDLKHVRSIHFAVLIVSGTMLYLVAAAWSEAPELYTQISSLTTFLRDYRTVGVTIEEVDPKKSAEVSDEILQSVRKASSTGLTWIWGERLFTDPHCMPLNAGSQYGATLGQMIQDVTSSTCRFLMPTISEEQAKRMRDWLATQPRDLLTHGPYIVDFDVAPDLGPFYENSEKTVQHGGTE